MKFLACMPYTEEQKERLRKVAEGHEIVFKELSKVDVEDVKDVDAILGNVPVGLVKQAPKLRWLQTNSAGADQYCKEGVLHPDCMLTNASGAYGTSVSEWMVAESFMLPRKLDLYMRNQVNHVWKDEGDVTSVVGAHVLVLGLGDIGGHYAEKMHALGSYVVAVTKHAHKEHPAYVDEMHTIEELDMLLPKADIVAMVLPGTEENRDLMNMRRFQLMKKTAYLINAGRGNSVNNLELNEALHQGIIAGAALDVTDPEPLPADHPLWDAPRCIITPHISGKFHLAETFLHIVDFCAENMEKFIAGEREQMINQVNRTLGY